MDTAQRQKIAETFEGPRSICTCGHTGDINSAQTHLQAEAEHHGAEGHGACKVCPEGKCDRFTWEKWTPAFEKAIGKK